MPKSSIIDSLRQKWKRSIPSDVLKVAPVLDLGEREQVILTY